MNNKRTKLRNIEGIKGWQLNSLLTQMREIDKIIEEKDLSIEKLKKELKFYKQFYDNFQEGK